MLYLSEPEQTFQTRWGAEIHSPIKAVSSLSLINIARRFVLWGALKRGVARPELCILRFPKATLNLPVPFAWSKSHGEENISDPNPEIKRPGSEEDKCEDN